MRGLVIVLLGFATTLHSQGLRILPPVADSSAQRIFFGTSLSPEGLSDSVDVYALGAAGQQRLTNVKLKNYDSVIEFAVRGDGMELAYAARVGPASGLNIADLSTGAEHFLPFPPNPDRPGSPHFVESTNQVIFDLFGAPSQHTPAFGAPIYIANTDGTGLKRLHRGALAPGPQRVVSKDGVVVFTSADPFSTHALPQPPANVYVMNADGSNVRAVTNFTVPAEGASAAPIAAGATISTAGDVIAFEIFSGTRPGALSQIWTIAADGSNLTALTQPEERCDAPTMTSDGSRVAFVCKGQLYVEGRDGTARQALTHFRLSSASSPVISSDGTRVFFTLGPSTKSAGPISGPMQQDSYPRGAIFSVNTDGSSLKPAYTPRVLAPQGVVDALSYSSLFPPVGGLITAFGTNLSGDTMEAAPAMPLPEELNGVSLLVNRRPVPLLAVTPWQVNAQLPPGLRDGPARFAIRFQDGSISNEIEEEVREVSPNVLTIPGASSADCQDAVLHGGTGVAADAAHPASADETVLIFVTGLGPTEPQVHAGLAAPASPLATLRYPVSLLVGGMPAPVAFAGLTPGLIGIYQINATIPAGLSSGRQQITLSVNGGTLFTNACSFWVI